MPAHRLISAFNAGEISPLMDARVDSEKYPLSCRVLENFIPRIYGGAFRRAGMEYLGAMGDATAQGRLIPFNYSTNTRFVIELGDAYARFWSNGIQAISFTGPSPYGDPLEVVTPYAAADLFEVQFVQLNDTMFFTHPNYPVQKLTRLSDSYWTWEEVTWKWPCFADENVSTVTATVAATGGGSVATIGDSATLTFNKDGAPYAGFYVEDVLSNGWIGTHFQVIHRRDNSFIELEPIGGNGNDQVSSELPLLGGWDFFSYGTWNGEVRIEKKADDGTFETVRAFTGKKDRNIASVGSADTNAIYRIRYNNTGTATVTSPRFIIEAADSRVYGVVKVTGTTSAGSTTVPVEIIKPLLSEDATSSWASEAWTDVRGHPRCVTFHEQRLIFGGNESAPNTFWGSTIGDFENFQRTGFDDASFAFTLAATEGSSLQTIVSHRQLLFFTESEEWSATTPDSATITPNNIYVRRQSRIGSEHKAAFVAGNSIMFLQRGARKLREFVLSEFEATNSPDLTLLAEHITRNQIRQMAFQQQPDPIIWAVTETGELLSMTYERDQNVVAWSRHPTSGTVESVAVVYGSGGGNTDEVWLIVKRSVNGADVRYVERIDPASWVKLEDSATRLDDMVYSDSAKTVSVSTPGLNFAGFDHLEGETVTILADGEARGSVVVGSSGTVGRITLATNASQVVAGLPYTSMLQPSRTEVPLDDGTSQGRVFNCNKATLRVWETLGAEYADNPDEPESDWYPIEVTESDELLTGDIKINLEGGMQEGLDIAIRQSKPLPCNVLGIIATFEVMGE